MTNVQVTIFLSVTDVMNFICAHRMQHPNTKLQILIFDEKAITNKQFVISGLVVGSGEQGKIL